MSVLSSPSFALLTLLAACTGVPADKADTDATDEPVDADGDRYPEGEDCDDADATAHPGATELCNDIDDDCDGTVDEPDAADAPTWYADADGDTYGDAATGAAACAAPTGAVADATDCDDTDGAVFPGAAEVCNGADDDCDGDTDSGALDALTWYADVDGDTFGDLAASSIGCTAPAGTVADATDCDDTIAAVFPGAAEVCNGVDDDCDGAADAGALDALIGYADADGDTFGDAAAPYAACALPGGVVADATDCDDTAAAVFPGAAETCNGEDDDCDAAVDEEATDAITWYPDTDADGYGTPGTAVTACEAPPGYAGTDTDCDDAVGSTFPGAAEVCDDADQDCDGTIDEDALDARAWFDDADADGHGDAASSTYACDAPSGYVAVATDCDDGNVAVNPDEDEVCDLVDNDCSGAADDSPVDGTLAYADVDGDGHGDSATATFVCEVEAGFTVADGDCDDDDAHVWPGAPLGCDGGDHDCDGTADAHVTVPGTYATIQAAIDGAPDFSAVCVGSGTYTEELDLGGRILTLRSVEGSASTVVDSAGGGRTVWLYGNADVALVGFTFTDSVGGDEGLSASQDSSIVGRDLVFEGYAPADTDRVVGLNGVAAVSFDELTIRDSDCTRADGCAMYGLFVDEVTLTDVRVENVTATGSTSGIVYLSPDVLTVRGAVFTGNTVAGGYSGENYVAALVGSGVVDGVTFTDNTVGLTGAGGFSPLYLGVTGTVSGVWASGNVTTLTGTSGTAYPTVSLRTGGTLAVTDVEVIDNVVSGPSAYAGGVSIEGYDSYGYTGVVTVDGLTVTGNTTTATSASGTARGGGAWASGYRVAITDALFADNVAAGTNSYGGALFVDGDVALTNVIVAGNGAGTAASTGAYGGGIYVSSGTLTATNVDVVGNTALGTTARGGGIGASGSVAVTLVNTNVAFNTLSGTTTSGGAFGTNSGAGSLTATYSNFYGNSSAEFAGVATPSSATNLFADPLYVDRTSSTAALWDLTLGSGSTVVDAGSGAISDADGSRSDIGAHGGAGFTR